MERRRTLLSLAVVMAFALMSTATSRPPKSSATIPDLDLDRVRAAAGCAGNATAGCRLLEEFAAAAAYDPPKNEAFWYGETIGLDGTTEVRSPFYLRISDAGGGARAVILDRQKYVDDASALLVATKEGRAVFGNEVAAIVRGPFPGGAKELVRTNGRSVSFATTPPRVYIRKSGARVLILEYDGQPFGYERFGSEPRKVSVWIAETWPLP